MHDLIKNGAINIFRKKLRASLTILGISIGVFSVLIISTIGNMGTDVINTELESIGIDSISVSVNPENMSVSLNDSDLQTISTIPNIKSYTPLTIEYTKSEMRKREQMSLIWGVNDNAANIVSLQLKHGRLINKSDISSSKKVCIIDENYAKTAYNRSNIVGKNINIMINGSYQEFQVVGVVSSGGNILQNLMGSYIPNFVYVPFTSLQRLSNKTNFDQIIVSVNDMNKLDEVSDQITTNIETEKGVFNSIKVDNLTKEKEKFNNILNIVNLTLSTIAAISLIVSGLSIMTIMLVSVRERTREIGIKKAIGATKFKILFEFIIESFILSLLGGLSGIITGSIAIFIGCSLIGMPFYIEVPLILYCIIFTLIIGLIFGSYPSIKAAKLKPVDALKLE